MRRLIFSDRAVRDLISIRQYIAFDSPSGAVRINDRLAAACASLVFSPDKGRPGRKPGTRELVTVRPYIVIYSVTEETVEIFSVFHGAQNR